jgi:hypothetical protein
MSHRLKLTLFLLAFNIIGFGEGYCCVTSGSQWLVPIVFAMT